MIVNHTSFGSNHVGYLTLDDAKVITFNERMPEWLVGCPFIFDSTIRWSAIEASENSAWNYIGKQTGGERKE